VVAFNFLYANVVEWLDSLKLWHTFIPAPRTDSLKRIQVVLIKPATMKPRIVQYFLTDERLYIVLRLSPLDMALVTNQWKAIIIAHLSIDAALASIVV
jgi:hypothetical protein